MRSNISTVDKWLLDTLQSNVKFDIINIETGYESAVRSLTTKANHLIDEFKKEELFNCISELITSCRLFIKNNPLLEKDMRLSYLENFEIILRKTLKFDVSNANKLIDWTGQKDLLAEIFVHLKQNLNKHNKPLITNSYSDIAEFLKNNFDCYKDTKHSTIVFTLNNISGKLSRDEGKITFRLNKE